ncbi:MAG TPA: 1-acyl-sn-glycerol-3-phosphate acyltransferase, partial [Helicobacter sp.]|nr:1-acyl-sn-glycerol-3-phosphate acyltransferase [Helicobacter sp.]
RVVLMEAFTPDFSDENWYEKLRESMHEVYLKHYYELNQNLLSDNKAKS